MYPLLDGVDSKVSNLTIGNHSFVSSTPIKDWRRKKDYTLEKWRQAVSVQPTVGRKSSWNRARASNQPKVGWKKLVSHNRVRGLRSMSLLQPWDNFYKFNRRLGLRVGDEERRLMHLVPAPAVRLMKRRVQSRPGVRQQNNSKKPNVVSRFVGLDSMSSWRHQPRTRFPAVERILSSKENWESREMS